MSPRKKPNDTPHIDLTRVYEAPLRAVWDAWTDPDQAAQWWGPRGFTITTHSKDLRVGGVWRYTMHGPDGKEYPNKTTYYEVEECAKLVYDHGATDDTPPLFRVTVLFSETNGKTSMHMRCKFATPLVAAEMRKFIQAAGGNATWDRLDEYLGTHQGEERFVIHRSFDAPIEQMFEMWTNPTHLARWTPPTGSEMEFLSADIREGGGCLYVMSNPSFKMYGRTQYLEITPPHRIVYTQQFCDENGVISRHPLAPSWPETMLTVVELYPEGPDQTRVKITWRPNGEVQEAELAVFMQARGGMTQGWTGSFDKLDAYLENQP
jgi:uncharacterized protein YndB with AHSA1/START domain